MMSDVTEPRLDDRGRPLCEGLTKRRKPCLATAMPGGPFCETHDPTGKGLAAQSRRSKATLVREAYADPTSEHSRSAGAADDDIC